MVDDPAPNTNAATSKTDPDPEVTAIGKVNDALTSLDPAIQQRVLRWAADRFSVTLSQANKPAHDGDKGKQQEEKQKAEQPGSYNDFASLYDAVSPMTEADKALVAGYWLQVLQDAPEWSGFSANKELKHLGHGVENITVALSQLIESTPRLVMQTHKAGKTKQARKKYKLTNEGIRKIRQMLAAGGRSEDDGQE